MSAKLAGLNTRTRLRTCKELKCTSEGNDICVQVYLEPRGTQNGSSHPESSNWLEVAKLLGRKHHIIEPLHALSLVPEEVLTSFLPFAHSLLYRENNSSQDYSL